MSFLRAWFPRLSFRLYYGLWCDHEDYVIGSGYTMAEAKTNTHTEFGWGGWQLFDMGRNKIRTCNQCWYSETLTDKPIRRTIARWWRAYYWPARVKPAEQNSPRISILDGPAPLPAPLAPLPAPLAPPPAATMAQVSNVLSLALPEVSRQLGSITRGERDLIATCLISAFDVRTRTNRRPEDGHPRT